MPKIPTFVSNASPQVPGIDPGQFSRVSRAEAQAGSQIAQMGLQAADLVSRQQEEEVIAERTLKSIEIDNGLKSDLDELAATYQDRDDYQNFDKDRETQLSTIRNKYMVQVGNDRILQVAFERRFSQESLNFSNMVRTKKRDVMSKRALGGFEITYNQSLQNYAAETDPLRREMIKKDIEIGVATLVSSRFLTEAQGEAKIQNFINESEQVRADQMIETDPTSALEALKGGDFPELDPKIRQGKIEKAILRKKQNEDAEKVAVAAEEKRIKEEKKIAHDKEERTLGELFINGDYDAIIPALKRSPNLSGDELAIWTNKVKEATKVDRKIDPAARSIEIVKINHMIDTGQDPAKTYGYIAGNPNLEKGDYEQYINKLDTKLGSEIEDGRREGNRLIQGLIYPKAGMGATFQNTPFQVERTAQAQIALDEWIKEQRGLGKVLSKNDVVKKAMALGRDYAISFVEMNDYNEKVNMKNMEELARRQNGQ